MKRIFEGRFDRATIDEAGVHKLIDIQIIDGDVYLILEKDGNKIVGKFVSEIGLTVICDVTLYAKIIMNYHEEVAQRIFLQDEYSNIFEFIVIDTVEVDNKKYVICSFDGDIYIFNVTDEEGYFPVNDNQLNAIIFKEFIKNI